MNKQSQEILEALEYQYQERLEERDRILKIVNQDKTHKMCEEVNNKINEYAQLLQAMKMLYDEPVVVEEVRQRLAFCMLGFKHKKRRDSETPELY